MLDNKLTSDLLRGHTDTIILKFLSDGDKYGYEITKLVYELSAQQYELKEATMYSSLKRLEQDSHISSYWGDETQGGRRRYYRITQSGRDQYAANKRNWIYAKQLLDKLGDTPMKDMFPPEKHRRIINAHLKSGDLEFSATDWMASPDRDPQYGNIFAIFVEGQGFDELKTVFDKLSQGAQKDGFQELHDMPFGTFGQFYDKYGYQWIFKGDKREP